MAPGAKNKFGAIMFEPEVFRNQMCWIEQSFCENVGSFWSPANHSSPLTGTVPGVLCPIAPIVTPLQAPQNIVELNKIYHYNVLTQFISQLSTKQNNLTGGNHCFVRKHYNVHHNLPPIYDVLNEEDLFRKSSITYFG